VDIMRNPHDQLAKQIGEKALTPLGATVTQAENSPETQYADIKHEPDPARAAGRQRLGLLGQIASVLCLIEVYSDVPNGDEFRACLAKHIAFWRQQTRKGRAGAGVQEPDPQSPEPSVAPFLWVITAGVPTTLLAELKLEAASGWPPGVYLLGGKVLRAGVVVASKLPRDRSTLLVRLMAAGPLRQDAMPELFELPPDAHERAVAEESLLRYLQELEQKPNRDSEDEAFMETMHRKMEDYRTEGHAKGHAKGLAEGSAKALLTVLQGRGIAVPDAARERILAEQDPVRLTHWLERAGVVTSIEELIGNAR
jgi:hypothetical protein